MKKHVEKIKKHLVEEQHRYKVALLFVVLLAIFFFARTVGNGAHQAGEIICQSNNDCSDNQFCEFDNCLLETGRCVDVPEVCLSLWEPVCGCDSKSYSNDCARKVSKISKKHDGICI